MPLLACLLQAINPLILEGYELKQVYVVGINKNNYSGNKI
jgi:hypothetical protein